MQITSYNNNSSNISVAKNYNQQSIGNNTLVDNKTFNSSFNAYNMKPGMINPMSVNSKLEKLIGGVKAPPTHRLFQTKTDDSTSH